MPVLVSAGAIVAILLAAPAPAASPAAPGPTQPNAISASAWMMTSTAVGDSLPFAAGSGKPWSADRPVRLQMWFEHPFELQGLEMDACSELPPAGMDRPVFYWGDQLQSIRRPTGDFVFVKGEFYEHPDKRALPTFDPVIVGSSLAISFPHPPCVEKLQLFSRNHVPVEVHRPRLVKAAVRATSVLPPESSYGVMNLFDSRPGFAWSTNGKSTADIVVAFDSSQRVERIAIWNGYQRSDLHWQENSRARRIELRGEDGYVAPLDVADLPGVQVLTLPVPFAGKNLTLRIAAEWPGTKYRDLAISELRFFDGQEWFLPDPLPSIQKQQATTRARFDKAGLAGVLDVRLLGSPDQDLNFSLQLRSDGTATAEMNRYVPGGPCHHGEGFKHGRTEQFAEGSFEVLDGPGAGGLRLRLSGILRTHITAWLDDETCSGCAADKGCRVSEPPDTWRIFSQEIQVGPVHTLDDGKTVVTLNSGDAKPALDFRSTPSGVPAGTALLAPLDCVLDQRPVFDRGL